MFILLALPFHGDRNEPSSNPAHQTHSFFSRYSTADLHSHHYNFSNWGIRSVTGKFNCRWVHSTFNSALRDRWLPARGTWFNGVGQFLKTQKGNSMFQKSDIFILLAVSISFALSGYLWFTGQRAEGVFTAIWVPSILCFGIYFKLMSIKGSGSWARNLYWYAQSAYFFWCLSALSFRYLSSIGSPMNHRSEKVRAGQSDLNMKPSQSIQKLGNRNWRSPSRVCNWQQTTGAIS